MIMPPVPHDGNFKQESTPISIGAEASIYRGHETVVKKRLKKSYRLPALDNLLRHSRTKSEGKILQKLYAQGVRVPKIHAITNDSLVLERIKGQQLRDVLHKENCVELGRKLGDLIRQAHDLNIIHGDLTTSNVLVDENGNLVLIDFGLSYHSTRVEDKAVDLHVLEQSLEGKHNGVFVLCFEAVLESYADVSVIDRLNLVRARGKNKEKY